MGFYNDYLDKNMDAKSIAVERKNQLEKIQKIRGRDIIVFASDLTKNNAPISIEYSDLLPLEDQISNLKKKKIDLILETPGGSGEVSEDIVDLLRNRFSEVNIIIPGSAKSAGTIIAMACNEILMGPGSSLGPIDAQLRINGQVRSADTILGEFEKIKKEIEDTGTLNKAYIPMLQQLSLGQLEHARNAKNFAITLVSEWLVKYKFQNWTQHSSNGKKVTIKEKEKRAEDIANNLSKHTQWLTHGRSIKMPDLRKMKLEITDYSTDKVLHEAISRYYILLQMTFQSTNQYKIFETSTSQINRYIGIATPPLPSLEQNNKQFLIVEAKCGNCTTITKLQANLDRSIPIKQGHKKFPKDNLFICPKCRKTSNILALRQQIEAQEKKKIVS